jgi:uncharacterized protein (TIGR00369 family)
MAAMSPDELHAFLVREFPQSDPEWMRIELAEHRHVRIRAIIGDEDLRPGGTVSAKTLMSLANTAMFLAVLASIGPIPLAVATNLSIDFLRRPSKDDVIVDAKVLKLGSRLAVGDINIFSDGLDEPVAHATATYSIPPDREGKATEAEKG